MPPQTKRKIRIGSDYLSAQKSSISLFVLSRGRGSGSYNARSEIQRELENGSGPASYEFLRQAREAIFNLHVIDLRCVRGTIRTAGTAERIIKSRDFPSRWFPG